MGLPGRRRRPELFEHVNPNDKEASIFPLEYVILIAGGAIAGGFVAGLAGFGTGITAMGIWLYALPPSVAATLVVVCSVAAQIQTLPKIWHAVEFKRVAPFILPGLLAVPLGTLLLAHIDVRTFKLAIGCLLLLYALHSLAYRVAKPITGGGRIADSVVGFGGGILGGLAGLSGPLPTIWANMRGWSKDQRKSVVQVFNLTITGAALLSHFVAGLITKELGLAVAVALPGTFIGAFLGAKLYARVSEQRFSDIVLILLGLSGVVLLATNL